MRPIWESASRPLFVRSVWQEAIGRRHFILDYEPRQRQRWKRQKTLRPKGNYQQSPSCEEYDQSAEESIDLLDEYLLLDATKLTLQQQQSFPSLGGRMNGNSGSALGSREQRQNSRQAKRRAWLLSRGKTYHLDHHLPEHQSRRSSLQDPSATTVTANNPEERLAERVLHWLDLAGRTDIVKEVVPSQPVSSSAQVARANQRSQRIHHRAVSLKRMATAAGSGSHQRSMARKPIPKPQQTSQSTHTVVSCSSASANANANANAKPITIIFNKEGIPVRLNRPARNIDLCALSSSASATRRLAGQLASARLYSGAAASPPHSDETRTPPHSSRGALANGLGSSVSLDSRKQLHIFMPSLPKKGLLAPPAGGAGAGSGEDALSVSFSELCQL
ncbi:uncharacterized protein LOC117890830 [Drosophila subobscura]|uniref:uncharacterized protein LOC117890830 n=1 Tax=Drosophila subobscura TaxID=7241 RepID=UPI00155A3AD3|nr:uncharacterized protein LOC117890830 [Drosophila subobscura]